MLSGAQRATHRSCGVGYHGIRRTTGLHAMLSQDPLDLGAQCAVRRFPRRRTSPLYDWRLASSQVRLAIPLGAPARCYLRRRRHARSRLGSRIWVVPSPVRRAVEISQRRFGTRSRSCGTARPRSRGGGGVQLANPHPHLKARLSSCRHLCIALQAAGVHARWHARLDSRHRCGTAYSMDYPAESLISGVPCYRLKHAC